MRKRGGRRGRGKNGVVGREKRDVKGRGEQGGGGGERGVGGVEMEDKGESKWRIRRGNG